MPVLAQAPTDAEILGRVANGDAAAVEELYDRHSSSVFGMAMVVTHDRGLAEDATQETFVALWKNAARFDPTRATARTWIMAIAHHRAVDAVRRRRAASLSLDADDGLREKLPPSPDVWPEISARVDQNAIKRAFTKLPEAQRQSLELAYFGGMTQIEIASATGVPLGTVKGRVRLGLLRMRDLLTDEYAADFAGNAA